MMNFQFPSRQIIYEKIEWIKEKAFWMLIVLLVSLTVFFFTLWITLIAFFILQPQPYSAAIPPQFQTKKTTEFKLFAVFQNLQLKGGLCSEEGYVYAGTSMSQDEFCSFKYQNMPKLNGPFDISISGLKPVQVRYASICILRLPKYVPRAVINQSEEQSYRPPPRYSYVCQKYRVFHDMHIANSINPDSLVFLEVQLDLTEKGFEQFQGRDASVKFQEQDANVAWRFIVDYFWILVTIASVIVAGWAAFVTFALGLGVIIKLILSEKQAEEDRLVSKLKNKKKEE